MEEFARTIAEARDGDGTAWACLYDTWTPRLTGYLRSQGSRGETDDLVGEVWYHAARDLGRFAGDERAWRRWLFTIARNRLIDARRRGQVRPFVPVAELPDRPDRRAGPEDQTEQRLADAAIIELLSELTDLQREALALRVFAGMQLAEIAAVTGRRRGAVKQAQRRAIATLRDRWVPPDESCAYPHPLGVRCSACRDRPTRPQEVTDAQGT